MVCLILSRRLIRRTTPGNSIKKKETSKSAVKGVFIRLKSKRDPDDGETAGG